MKEKEFIELLKELEDNDPTEDTRVALRKAELDENLDQLIHESPIVHSAWSLYQSHENITFEHMLLEIVVAQHESLTDLRKSYEDHIMRNPNPVKLDNF